MKPPFPGGWRDLHRRLGQREGAGILGIRQADTFAPAKGVIQSIERTYQAVDDDDADTWEVVVEYTVDGKTCVSDLGQTKDSFAVGKEIDILYDPSEPEVIVLQGKTLVPHGNLGDDEHLIRPFGAPSPRGEGLAQKGFPLGGSCHRR